MSPHEAHSVFSRFGIDSKNKSSKELKTYYVNLIKKHHPDQGGDVKHAQEINSAWDTLKNNRTSNDPIPSKSASNERTPEWAMAGHTGGNPPNHSINRNNYTDLNFIKKDLWNKSGGSDKEYTIHHFDGNHFRNSITTYGNDNLHRHMANASNMFNSEYRSKAIFVSKRESPHTLKMIWANGKHLDKPIETMHQSFNTNPANDQHFTRNLSSWIDSRMK